MNAEAYLHRGVIGLIKVIIKKTKTHVLVLDNLVYIVGVQHVPIAEFKAKYEPRTITADKWLQIFRGLANYAVSVGMTAEAAEYLPHLTKMSKEEISEAMAKGKETAARHAEGAAKERKLAGAALIAFNKKQERLAAEAADNSITAPTTPVAQSASEGETFAEPGTSTNATETGAQANEQPGDDTTVIDRRRNSKKAQTAKQLAAEVTKDLTAAEAKGENPSKLVNPAPSQKAKVTKVIKAEKKQESAERRSGNFDAAKLKDSTGEYKSVSAMFKGLILENVDKKKPLTDDQIFDAVQKKFGEDKSKRGYVAWNRNWLKTNGLI